MKAQAIASLMVCVAWSCQAVTNPPSIRRLSLNESIQAALLNNRDLQIEQLNPAIARAVLGSSYGYYDPVFLGDVRRESDKDTGGFDPANFSADAVYEAESVIANAGISGALPSGMSYTISGNYANAYGNRNSLDFDSYKLFAGVTARQPLLKNMWIDAGRYTIKISRQNVTLSEYGLRFIAMDVVNSVEQAYYELAFAHEAKRIQQELIETRRRMVAATRRKIENGLATLPDEQLAQSQLAVAQTALDAYRGSVALAENSLRTLMADTFTNQLHTGWEPSDYVLLLREELELGESWRRGLNDRPDLAQFRVEIQKADVTVKYRRNQLFPSLDLTASYGRRGASSDQDVAPFRPRASLSDAAGQFGHGDAPRDMVGIIFSVPLGLQAERSNYKASKHLRAQAEILLKQKEELVLREISDALQTARTAYDRAISAREAARLARSALEAEEKRLSGGTSSIFFILQLQNDLVASQLLEARARADYNQALAQLRFSEGSSLNYHRIGVDVYL